MFSDNKQLICTGEQGAMLIPAVIERDDYTSLILHVNCNKNFNRTMYNILMDNDIIIAGISIFFLDGQSNIASISFNQPQTHSFENMYLIHLQYKLEPKYVPYAKEFVERIYENKKYSVDFCLAGNEDDKLVYYIDINVE